MTAGHGREPLGPPACPSRRHAVRHRESKFQWMMSAVSSSYRAVSARSTGSLREFTNFTILILGKMCKHIVPAAWFACVWSFGPFCDIWETGWLFFGAYPHVIRRFLFWLNYRLFHHDTVCVSRMEEGGGGSPERPSAKKFINHMIWHLEFAVGRLTPSKEHRVYKVLQKLPQLVQGSQTCT